MTKSAPNWAAVFGEVFAEPVSPASARVFAEVLGDDYPAEVSPYSFTTRTELARIAAEVRVGAGQLLVDVGGGRGGPGLWVAATTGADYLDVDIAEQALAEVRARAGQLGMDGAQARLGSFEAMPLADGEADAVMSIDALLFTPDKAAALRELARVLCPGGRLVFTSWDYVTQPANRPPQVDDHAPLLAAAGLTVVAYEETPDWLNRHRRIDRLLMAAAQDLADEAGVDVVEVRAGLAEMAATVDAMRRRILVVAQR